MNAPEAAVSTAAAVPAGRRKNLLGWGIVGVLVLIVALIAVWISPQMPARHPALDPEGHASNGTMALAEVLRSRGVTVTVVRSRAEVHSALRQDSTLVFPHPPALSDDALVELAGAANRTVVISASARLLRLLELGEDAFVRADPAPSRCDWPPFSRVGDIHPSRLFVPAPGVTGCFTDAEGNAAVLLKDRDQGLLALVHAPEMFTNEYLAENGNAALGLALLGQSGHVVWYVPSVADSDLEWTAPDTLGSLTPAWLTSAIVVLLLAGVAAAIWRGRRFGPLVAETLPVTVRASETMQGRAHLTARAGDAAHAAAALHRGTVARLARRLGLSARAGAAEVADAAADRLRIPRAALRDLLQEPLVHTDAELIDFARALDDLERAVDESVHTERSTP